MSSNAVKVFGIGFHKTATKSLATALGMLGYRVHGPGWVSDPQACSSLESLWARALPIIDDYDAFQDNPWPLLWPFLVEHFPKSRFILTVRDESEWLNSAKNYFGEHSTPMRQLIYGADAGSPVGNEARYLERYRQHNDAVRTFFAGDPRFLELDITAGEGWSGLCSFLGCPPPNLQFPHANRG